MAQIVVLGAGFGGLEAVTILGGDLGTEHETTLIDKNDKFHIGPSKLWVAMGERTEIECYTDISLVRNKGINFVRDEVTEIRPESQTILARLGGSFHYDFLVVALGANPAPQLVKGFENALDLYDIKQGESIYRKLQRIQTGIISIVLSRPPFVAGGAPYEGVLIIDDLLRRLSKRERISLRLFTPEPRPMVSLSKQTGDMMISLLGERNIEYHPNTKLIEIKANSVVFDSGEFHSDLTLLVPPHVPPPVVKVSGLTEGDWIEADKRNFSTRFHGIYAVGDCTGIKLANGMSLPKAGVVAEAEARIVASNIVSELKGSPKQEFDGRIEFLPEVGLEKATRLEMDFFAEPNPAPISMDGPSEENKRRKLDFEKERIERWFHSRA